MTTKTTKPAKTTTVGQDLDALIAACREQERRAFDATATTDVEKLAQRIKDLGAGKAGSLSKLVENIIAGYMDSMESHLVALHKNEVYAMAVEWLGRKELPLTPAQLLREAMSNAVRYAKYNYHSTSPMASLRAEAQASAWADIVEVCGGIK